MRVQFQSVDRFTRGFLRFVIAAAVLVHVLPRIEAEQEAYGTRTTPNEYPDPFPGVLAAISRYTLPTDRIFTVGPPSLYVEADRISAVRESAIVDEALGYYDGDTDEEKLSGLRAELEKNRPKLLITDPWIASRRVRTNAALVVPFLKANHYREIEPNIWLRPD